jgi:hypothetical protein
VVGLVYAHYFTPFYMLLYVFKKGKFDTEKLVSLVMSLSATYYLLGKFREANISFMFDSIK